MTRFKRMWMYLMLKTLSAMFRAKTHPKIITLKISNQVLGFFGVYRQEVK
jgi:hypothetical protein